MDLFRGVDDTCLRPPSSFAGTRDSRAIASAIRFASDAPFVKLPTKPSHPIALVSQLMTVRSIVTAAGAERQAVAFWFSSDA